MLPFESHTNLFRPIPGVDPERYGQGMATWRYVVSRTQGGSAEEFQWEIRELYPGDDGRFGYTENPVSPAGDSFEELLSDLEHMRSDADLEILDLTTDPPRLISRSDLEQQSR